MQAYFKDTTIPLRARPKPLDFTMEPCFQAMNRRWCDVKWSASGIELIRVMSGVLL